ncbi:MAG: hypothetical protein ACK4SF_11870 [Algoriphagus aquaeductus]|uniref:hypothetical protein n=1 Tax=Algoriphagus aquaeductus TaxID=475299 RepID=UPI003919ECB5
MINYFKKLFSGYATARRQVSGVICRYQYAGKPVFFDPMLMLREFLHRFSTESVQKEPYTGFEEEINQFFVTPIQEVDPSVICTCEYQGRELKVFRFSLKEGTFPLSIYRFYWGGELLGQFRRKYDYGSQVSELYEELYSKYPIQQQEKWTKLLFNTQTGGLIFLEKFGHSQLWYFPDAKLFQEWRSMIKSGV